MVIFSYLGWVGAQITALGLVFNMLSHGSISLTWGMALGTAVVLLYTLYGGMWSVALTDFVQMIVIVLGLMAIAWYAAGLAGGAQRMLEFTASEGKFRFFPTGGAKEWLFFVAAAITMMLGSIPQQDGIAERIAETIPDNIKNILEIGSGTGALTQFLLKKNDTNLLAIEIDKESCAYLGEHYPQLRVFRDDFLTFDFDRIFDGEPFGIVVAFFQ